MNRTFLSPSVLAAALILWCLATGTSERHSSVESSIRYQGNVRLRPTCKLAVRIQGRGGLLRVRFDEEKKRKLIEESERVKNMIQAEHKRHKPKGKLKWESAKETKERKNIEGEEPASPKEALEMERKVLGFNMEQTHHDITVTFMVPNETRGSDVRANFTSTTMILTLGEKVKFNGTLFGAIKPKESVWELEKAEDGTRLVINLVKNPPAIWDLFEDGSNAESKVNPSPHEVIKKLRSKVEIMGHDLQKAEFKMRRFGNSVNKHYDDLEKEVKSIKESIYFNKTATFADLAWSMIDAVETLDAIDFSSLSEESDIREKVLYVRKNLNESLAHAGVSPMENLEGTIFNPAEQTVAKWYSLDECGAGIRPGTIVGVTQNGYYANNEGSYVIKKAHVEVVKEGEVPSEQTSTQYRDLMASLNQTQPAVDLDEDWPDEALEARSD